MTHPMTADLQEGGLQAAAKAICGSTWQGQEMNVARTAIKAYLTRSPADVEGTAAGVVVLDADEFAELQGCMKNPPKPTPSIIEGAEQIRRLYSPSPSAEGEGVVVPRRGVIEAIFDTWWVMDCRYGMTHSEALSSFGKRLDATLTPAPQAEAEEGAKA